MRLFDGHVATIKVIIIEVNVNYFLVNKISKTISSHLKEKDRDKKNKKATGFHCGMDDVSAELSSTEDNPRERIIVERFSSSAPSTTFTPERVHAVISVIHEKV